ncbi:hypothetical protein AOQ84DRAFT_214789 [Glonium stellatum]|uniref:Uncharacterized protein n=1 Tax=Glonium stellatum TaxID=574774 RepID=A0A8E2JUX4_9PEZI|nr:hypothetical protein AOQ84DRAFT_214789 [Glonium stellatum]
MAAVRKLRRASKANAFTKNSTKKQTPLSKQTFSIKKAMKPPQPGKRRKTSEGQVKKIHVKKIEDQDKNEVLAPITMPRVGFMDLSGELRNQIYREVLHFEDAIMVGQKSQTGDRHAVRDSDSWAKRLSLLHISSQIRKEAISIYYGENTFLYTGELLNHPAHLAKPICTAVRFRKWCEDMGAENIKWIKKLQIKFGHCWTCNRPIPRWWPSSSMCDIYPYVEFAVKHPNCELELAELRPLHSFHANCACCHPRPGSAQDPVLFSEKTAIIKEPAWVEEIAAGNIVRIQAYIGRDVRVDKVIYAREASNRTNREDKWQELCDKLSLHYAFELKPESVRGGMRFMMQVQKRQMPDIDMIDIVR